MEENVKKTVRDIDLTGKAVVTRIECDHVLFVERANELWCAARLRCWSIGAEGKPSLKRASSCML